MKRDTLRIYTITTRSCYRLNVNHFAQSATVERFTLACDYNEADMHCLLLNACHAADDYMCACGIKSFDIDVAIVALADDKNMNCGVCFFIGQREEK